MFFCISVLGCTTIIIVHNDIDRETSDDINYERFDL